MDVGGLNSWNMLLFKRRFGLWFLKAKGLIEPEPHKGVG